VALPKAVMGKIEQRQRRIGMLHDHLTAIPMRIDHLLKGKPAFVQQKRKAARKVDLEPPLGKRQFTALPQDSANFSDEGHGNAIIVIQTEFSHQTLIAAARPMENARADFI